eukprot:TRINITY_DN62231_c0_g1_i1.p1 TRINITY_DN62231_c0_g1~~TRINITY_DN62231_c0_g1_i1.p1  ORF type:complete len:250 (+),score=35.28 TRINITY_DN62231_c0_g1_i1:35-784(+)
MAGTRSQSRRRARSLGFVLLASAAVLGSGPPPDSSSACPPRAGRTWQEDKSARESLGAAFGDAGAAFGDVFSITASSPFALGVLACTIKAGLADVFTQKVLMRRLDLDVQRTLVFLVFGFFYMGAFQHILWNLVFESAWPGSSLRANLCKMLATNFISDPLFFFPVFYILREIVSSRAFDPLQTVPKALTAYRRSCVSDWTASWTFWIPGHYVTYFHMPIQLRLPWVACASFAYLCVLSWFRGDKSKST